LVFAGGGFLLAAMAAGLVLLLAGGDSGGSSAATASTGLRLLTSSEYAGANEKLADGVVELNRRQLRAWGTARQLVDEGSSPDKQSALDRDLVDVATQAAVVADLAQSIGTTAANQDEGSDAARQSAAPFFDIAALANTQVIEAQNSRDDLQKGSLRAQDTAAMLSEFGARLWNPAVNEKGLPPVAFQPPPAARVNVATVIVLSPEVATRVVTSASTGGAPPGVWTARSQDSVPQRLLIPPAQRPIPQLLDANIAAYVKTASGQGDPELSRRFAALQLARLNGKALTPSDVLAGATLDYSVAKGVSIAGPRELASMLVPSYARGTAVLMKSRATGESNPINELFGLSGGAQPQSQGSVPIADAARRSAVDHRHQGQGSEAELPQLVRRGQGHDRFHGKLVQHSGEPFLPNYLQYGRGRSSDHAKR